MWCFWSDALLFLKIWLLSLFLFLPLFIFTCYSIGHFSTFTFIFSAAQRENKSQPIRELHTQKQILAQPWQTTSKFYIKFTFYAIKSTSVFSPFMYIYLPHFSPLCQDTDLFIHTHLSTKAPLVFLVGEHRWLLTKSKSKLHLDTNRWFAVFSTRIRSC